MFQGRQMFIIIGIVYGLIPTTITFIHIE